MYQRYNSIRLRLWPTLQLVGGLVDGPNGKSFKRFKSKSLEMFIDVTELFIDMQNWVR